MLVFSVSASHEGSGGISADTGFQIPQYETQGELLTQLVAPFLMIAIVLQIGLQRALMFTLADDRNNWYGPDPQYKKEKAKVRKQSMVLALAITGMLVPTVFFEYIGAFTAIMFGGMMYILIAALVVSFLLVLKAGFSGGE